MSQDSYTLTGRFTRKPDGLFYGLVARIDKKSHTLTVCAIGVEETEISIMEWISKSISLMRETGRTDVAMPDMFERAQPN